MQLALRRCHMRMTGGLLPAAIVEADAGMCLTQCDRFIAYDVHGTGGQFVGCVFEIISTASEMCHRYVA